MPKRKCILRLPPCWWAAVRENIEGGYEWVSALGVSGDRETVELANREADRAIPLYARANPVRRYVQLQIGVREA